MITFSQLGNVGMWGRLGNQLFSIAATIGAANDNGQSFVFPPWSYSNYFANFLPTGVVEDAQIYYQKGFAFSPICLTTGNWDLRGSFQSERFFENVTDQVRHYFTPSSETSAYIQEKYRHLLTDETCSLHVRRGDYIRQRAAFPPQSVAYYRYAMAQFPATTRFLVFSDDIDWCRRQFSGHQFTFIEGEKDIIDLFLMSHCRHHITSNSSFSWWGAWLNPSPQKKVYCPAFWFGPAQSPFPKKFTRDLYASGFIPLSVPDSHPKMKAFGYVVLYPIYSLYYSVLTLGVRAARKLGVYR